jgi:uncharacterized RDD family membrane protein YckC
MGVDDSNDCKQPRHTALNHAEEREYAGFGIRAFARILDLALYSSISVALWMTILSVLSVIGQTGFPANEGGRNIIGWTLMPAASLIAPVVFSIGMLLAWATGTGICGMTLGKYICGLIVQKENGSPIRFGDALKREIAYCLDSVFYGMVGYLTMRDSDRRQRLGDRWAHTVVVERSSVSEMALPSRRRIIVGIGFSGLLFLVAFGTIMLV